MSHEDVLELDVRSVCDGADSVVANSEHGYGLVFADGYNELTLDEEVAHGAEIGVFLKGQRDVIRCNDLREAE